MTRDWYVVAFDKAGGVYEWRGPLLWRQARAQAERYERLEHVRRARVGRRTAYLHENQRAMR